MGFTVRMVGGSSLNKEIEGIFTDWKHFKKDFIRTGRNVHKFMIEYLKANKTGTSNASGVHLHNEIDFSYADAGDVVYVGIGDIEKLNTRAPWWAIQNFGGAHPMAGRFVPGGFSGKKFIYDPGSKTGMVVRADARIKPINYIENTEQFGTSQYQVLITLATNRTG